MEIAVIAQGADAAAAVRFDIQIPSAEGAAQLILTQSWIAQLPQEESHIGMAL